MSSVIDFFVSIYTFLSGVLYHLANIKPEHFLGGGLAVCLLLFAVLESVSACSNKSRGRIKLIYRSFSDIFCLVVLCYCLCECVYVGKVFSVSFAFLTSALFYLLLRLTALTLFTQKTSAAKQINELLNNDLSYLADVQRGKEDIYALRAQPILGGRVKADMLSDSRAAEEVERLLGKLNNSKLKYGVEEEKPSDKSEGTVEPVKDIRINSIRNLTEKLKRKPLTLADREEVDGLDRLSEELISIKYLDENQSSRLNNSLLSLLKMMAKYSV